ncbi:MAG TPA: MFS transporter [Geminicoccaceae bacterium]|nr:MFS transporter [Geminicoccaceae bacterium]
MSAAGLAAIRKVLAEPTYRTYQLGNSISLVGEWVQRTTVGWLAWDLTGASAWVGLLALADLAPGLLVGPFAGAAADRYDRQRVIMVCQALMGATALVLALLALLGRLGIWPLFALVLVKGTLVGANQPARLALIPALVPREHLPTAVALNSMIFNTARFVGPAVAGLLLATLGAGPAFLFNAFTYIVFVAALSRLRLSEVLPAGRGTSFLAEIGDGISYVVRHPGIGPLLLLFALSSLSVRPVGELLPGIAAQVFGRGAEAFATLSASLGLGAVIGGFWLAQRGGERLVAVCLGAVAGTCATTIVFVLSPSFELAVAAAMALGFSLVAGGVTAQTLVQLAVAPAYRGRTMALYGLIFRASPAVGALLLGALADRIGLRPTLTLGALACILVLLAIASRRHSMAAALLPDKPR